MGRDVGRDEGREQAQWRDLVARLELEAPIDPAEAPWPDRENVRATSQPGTVDPAPDGDTRAGADGTGNSDTEHGRGSADRSRVIRRAQEGGSASDEQAVTQAARADEQAVTQAARADEPALGGPRDYELDEPSDDDLDDDHGDRYIPPPLPPQPGLDPVAKGAWLALFGGPGYLLVATLLSWQITGWAALIAVAAFVAGFVVLVFRLGDGPSKRDGPDQGAVL